MPSSSRLGPHLRRRQVAVLARDAAPSAPADVRSDSVFGGAGRGHRRPVQWRLGLPDARGRGRTGPRRATRTPPWSTSLARGRRGVRRSRLRPRSVSTLSESYSRARVLFPVISNAVASAPAPPRDVRFCRRELVQLDLLGRSPLTPLAGKTLAGAGGGTAAPLGDVRGVQALTAQNRSTLV